MNPDWLVPQWPAPAQVHAVCTTRQGGCSTAPYDSLNLGDHVGDQPDDVTANRTLLQQTIGARPVFLAQVHGTQTVWLSDAMAPGTVADACITDQRQLACTIMVADCLPVLLTDAQGTLVAAAHVGWRGLAGTGGQDVLGSVLECFMTVALVERSLAATNLIAWLGPCIGPQAFEVGSEVREIFVSLDPLAANLFRPKPGTPATASSAQKWLADLAGLARLRLNRLGVTRIYGNNGSQPWCTASNPSRFFSHRRDGRSGRMAACIWLD